MLGFSVNHHYRTYDLDPPMSAQKVADKLSERISDNKYEFLMNNFAPPDMVRRRLVCYQLRYR